MKRILEGKMVNTMEIKEVVVSTSEIKIIIYDPFDSWKVQFGRDVYYVPQFLLGDLFKIFKIKEKVFEKIRPDVQKKIYFNTRFLTLEKKDIKVFYAVQDPINIAVGFKIINEKPPKAKTITRAGKKRTIVNEDLYFKRYYYGSLIGLIGGIITLFLLLFK